MLKKNLARLKKGIVSLDKGSHQVRAYDPIYLIDFMSQERIAHNFIAMCL